MQTTHTTPAAAHASHVSSAVDVTQLHEFDTVIDVRSENEFAEDHIPGAINLPLGELSARMLDAAEADRYGLVSRVVPDEELHASTLALAAKVAGYSLPALMAIKESVNRAYEGALSEGIGFERRQLHARFASDDAHEGMKAFLDKRAPVFTHR